MTSPRASWRSWTTPSPKFRGRAASNPDKALNAIESTVREELNNFIYKDTRRRPRLLIQTAPALTHQPVIPAQAGIHPYAVRRSPPAPPPPNAGYLAKPVRQSRERGNPNVIPQPPPVTVIPSLPTLSFRAQSRNPKPPFANHPHVTPSQMNPPSSFRRKPESTARRPPRPYSDAVSVSRIRTISRSPSSHGCESTLQDHIPTASFTSPSAKSREVLIEPSSSMKSSACPESDT